MVLKLFWMKEVGSKLLDGFLAALIFTLTLPNLEVVLFEAVNDDPATTFDPDMVSLDLI